MKTRRGIGLVVLLGLAGLAAGLAPAQVTTANKVTLDSSGKGTLQLTLESAVGTAAGIEGRLLFDPSRISGVELAMASAQPSSFIVRSHLAAPGELKWVVYSATDLIRADLPVLECRLQCDPKVYPDGFTSALVCELDLIGGADARVQQPAFPYWNVEVVASGRNQADPTWLNLF